MEDITFGEFLDTFGGRAIISAGFNYIMILIFMAFLDIAPYTCDQAVLYASLVSLPIWFILEFFIAHKRNRKPHIGQLIGGSILGILGMACLILPVLLLVHAY